MPDVIDPSGSSGPQRLGVGLFLPGSLAHLDLIDPLLASCDFFEISPETFLKGQDENKELLIRNDVYALQEIKTRFAKPFVAHGLQYSLGTALSASGEDSLQRWLTLIGKFHALFDFQWYTDHLGYSVSPEGLQTLLPLPLPHTQEAVKTVARRLAQLKSIVPQVGFENSVFYFTLGDPMREADFYNTLCREAQCHLLLDTHNIYTHCKNFNLDPKEFCRRINGENVIELHVSGGSESEPEWLEGPTFRLDSHDGPVPEKVWDLVEFLLPRCPHIRGATLERLDGTVEPHEVPQLAEELDRLRGLWERLVSPTPC